LKRALLSQLFLTSCSRFFCFAMEDFFAIFYLFFTTRALLALFAVWVPFIHHIDATASEDNFVPFRRIGLNRCSNFHKSYPLDEL
jgi:hypothetical protein